MTDREPVNIMGVIAFPEPDKSKRRIRFIDAEYNTLFYIPDGASIVIPSRRQRVRRWYRTFCSCKSVTAWWT